MSEEEREQRLEEFLRQREEAEAAESIAQERAMRSSASSSSSSSSMSHSQSSAERVAEREARHAFEQERLRLERDAALLAHEARQLSPSEFAMERERQQYFASLAEWELHVNQSAREHDAIEAKRLAALAEARAALETAQEQDGKLSHDEDQQLNEVRRQFEESQIALEQSQRQLATNRAEIERMQATEQQGEAEYDQRLIELEDQAQEVHLHAAALKQASDAAPHDSTKLAAWQEAHGEAEELLRAYEQLFEEKQDWLEMSQAQGAGWVHANEQVEVGVAELTRALPNIEQAYNALAATIEAARRERDARMEKLLDAIARYEQPQSSSSHDLPPRPIKPYSMMTAREREAFERDGGRPPVSSPPSSQSKSASSHLSESRSAPVLDSRATPSPLPSLPSLSSVPPSRAESPVSQTLPDLPESDVEPDLPSAPPTPKGRQTPEHVHEANTVTANKPPSPLPTPPPAPTQTPTPAEPSSTAPTIPMPSIADALPLIEYFSRGFDFSLHSLAMVQGAPRASSKVVYLWAEFPKLTTATSLASLVPQSSFFCCDAAKSRKAVSGLAPDAHGRWRVKEQKLPFAIIETIVLGKRTPVLQHVANLTAPEAHCFAFGGMRAMVSVEVESEKIRDEWTDKLKALLKIAKLAQMSQEQADRAAALVTPSTATPPPPSVSSSATTPPVSTPVTSKPSSSAPSSNQAPPKQPIATPSPIEPKKADPSPPKSTATPAATAPVPAPTPVPVVTSSLLPLLEVSLKWKPTKPLTDSLSLLAYGSVFRLFHTSTTSPPHLTGIDDYLFYVDFSARSESRLSARGSLTHRGGSVAPTPRSVNMTSPVLQASLYWSTPGKRQKVPGQVHFLTDIMRVSEGKHESASIFNAGARTLTNKQARLIPASHCFTLTVATSTSQPPSTMTLVIQTPSLAIRTLFLRGLYEIFERQFDKLRADAIFERDTNGVRDVDMPVPVIIDQQTEPDDDHLIEQPPPRPLSPRPSSPVHQAESARSTSPVPSSSSAVEASSPRSPRATTELLTLLLDVMSRGEEFTQHYFKNPVPKPSDLPLKRRIFLWVEFPDSTPAENDDEDDVIHSTQDAIVCWCDAITARGGPNASIDDKGLHRFVEPGHCFTLASVNSVLSGKRAQSLIHPANDRLSDSCCLSLSSSELAPPENGSILQQPHVLDLECDQPSTQQLWLGGLKHVLGQQLP